MGKYNKIYVLAPYKHATGGVELAHQLVDYLRNNNQQAYIVYVVYIKGVQSISTNIDVTKEYVKYNIKVETSIEDNPDNILILPELYFEFIYQYKKINIGCWWMSVDNRYSKCSFKEMFLFNTNPIQRMLCIEKLLMGQIKTHNSIKLLKQEEKRIVHLYQSHYAQSHLYSLGLSKVLPLSDYVNTEFNNDSKLIKTDIILYNPSKGYKYTKRIMRRLPNYNFVALKNLTREEVKELFSKAKLYIDFGKFPGKDRLPREAILNDCCIITGKFGASSFYEDVSIKEDYKFDVDKCKLSDITKRIEFVISHYDSCIIDFSFYKSRVVNEKETFENEIKDLFL